MDEVGTELTTHEELARLIGHELLRPDLSEQQVAEGCEMARQNGIAAVTVRPSDVDLAARWIESSGVTLASVVGWPHGSATTATKLYEARDLLRRGAREIVAVANIGKLVSREFQYVEMELLQLAGACHEAGGKLAVVFETPYLGQDLRVIACKIARRAEVDFVRASAGAAPQEDVQFLVARCAPAVVSAAGVESLDAALGLYRAGCGRLIPTATASLLADWRRRIAPPQTPPASAEGVH